MTEGSDGSEVALKDLFRAIFATKILVVSGLLIVSAIYWVAQIVMNYGDPTVYSYETRVNLTFKGADENLYPNGSPFSISDIVSPVVLNRVYESNELDNYIDRQSFISSFSIKPYTPERSFIIEKYNNLLSVDNLSSAEIGELQSELTAELSKSASDNAALTFTGTELDNLPKQLIEKLLRDVMVEWARHMVDDIGVGDFDEPIYSSQVIDVAFFDSIDYLISFELLLDRLDLLQENVAKIKSLPNGLVVKDDESGFSVPDLDKAILDIKRYQVAPLINPIKSLGIAKEPEIVKLYFENELQVLERQKMLLQQRRENVSTAYLSYLQIGDSKSPTPNSAQSPNIGNGSMIPQFGTEFLDRIVELTNAGADITYRQMLNSQELEISNELAVVNSESSRLKDILDSIDSNAISNQDLRIQYTKRVKSMLPAILEQLKDYFDISYRIYRKLSREDLGSASGMYKYLDGDLLKSTSRNILSTQNIQSYIIFCFLTLVVLVPLGMIQNSLKSDSSSDRS